MGDWLLFFSPFSLASLWMGTVGIRTPNGSSHLFGCFSRLSFSRSYVIARPRQLTRTRTSPQPCIFQSAGELYGTQFTSTNWAIMDCSRRARSWRRPQTALSSTFRAAIPRPTCPAMITSRPAGQGSVVTSHTSATAANLPKRLPVTVKWEPSRLSCSLTGLY
jgi:UDP:flavonoid glycosyltransferase YjiC (YdhE family)